jgi:hypothetical protein
MAVSDHMKPGYGPRRSCQIITVNPANRKIEASLKDRTIVQVAVFDTPEFFVWPKPREYWTIQQCNGIWMLDRRLGEKDDLQIDDLNPGEGKISADIVKTPAGKSVVIVDDSDAETGQILSYENKEWMNVDSLTLNVGSAVKLTNAIQINGVNFDGSSNITIPTVLDNSLSVGNHLLFNSGATFDGSEDKTIEVDAISENVSGTIVARDNNGDFSSNQANLMTLNLLGQADLNENKIVNLADPEEDLDAANKRYVDYINRYYGSFYDTTTQFATANNTAKLLKMNTIDPTCTKSVLIVNDSTITMTKAGVYNLVFSVQFANTSTQLQDAEIWLRKNGIDIPWSNKLINIPSKHTTDGHTIASWNWFVNAIPGNCYELVWSTSSYTEVSIVAETSSAGGPAIPSVALTVNKVG